MKRHLLTAAGIGLFLVAAAPKEDDVKKELDKWQGTWTVVAREEKGQKLSDDELKKMPVTLIIKDDKFTLKIGDQTLEGTFKIDPTKKPKAYDAKATNTQGQTEESVGIYEIEGDMLKVCFASPEKGRPKEFKTEAGSETYLHTYKKK